MYKYKLSDCFYLEELDGVKIYVNRKLCKIELRLPQDFFGAELSEWKERNKERLNALKKIYDGKTDLMKNRYDGQRN